MNKLNKVLAIIGLIFVILLLNYILYSLLDIVYVYILGMGLLACPIILGVMLYKKFKENHNT